jgi:adenylate cyclase
LLYGSLSGILQRSYSRLEKQDAQRNLERVEEVLAGDLSQLQVLTENWAAWDEAFTFIKEPNPEFIRVNMTGNAFESLGLNFILFANLEGEIVYGRGYDISGHRPVEVPVPASLQKHLVKGSPLMKFPHLAHHHAGLIPVDDQVLLVVVEPILRTDGTGPSRGVLLMGRYLDAATVKHLARRTQLDLTVYPLQQQNLPPALEPVLKDLKARPLGDRPPTQVQPLDKRELAGYALLPDLYGEPQVLVQATIPRDIYRQGQLSLRYLALALGGACVVSTVSILLLLEGVILRRLMRLSTEVQEIGRANDLNQRVQVTGDDELSRLSERVNDMLGELNISNEKLVEEQQKAERLLLNILPAPIAGELMETAASIPQHFDEVSILFADLVNFTQLSSRLSPIELVNLLNRIFSAFDSLAEQLGLEKIKTIGDAYMVAAGLPLPRTDNAEAIAEMALAMQTTMQIIQAEFGERLELRIGINTGVVVAGVIGTKKFIYDLWGDAVNVASRMESSSEPGMIQVTAATYEQLKDKYLLERRGHIVVKGRGEMETYWLRGRRSQATTLPCLPISALVA